MTEISSSVDSQGTHPWPLRKWITYGVLAWGIPTWLVFVAIFPYFVEGAPSPWSWWSILQLPIWLLGGAAWGWVMHAGFRRRSDRTE